MGLLVNRTGRASCRQDTFSSQAGHPTGFITLLAGRAGGAPGRVAVSRYPTRQGDRRPFLLGHGRYHWRRRRYWSCLRGRLLVCLLRRSFTLPLIHHPVHQITNANCQSKGQNAAQGKQHNDDPGSFHFIHVVNPPLIFTRKGPDRSGPFHHFCSAYRLIGRNGRHRNSVFFVLLYQRVIDDAQITYTNRKGQQPISNDACAGGNLDQRRPVMGELGQ